MIHHEEVADLMAENARLKDAIEQILRHMEKNGMGGWRVAKMARKALGKKEG